MEYEIVNQLTEPQKHQLLVLLKQQWWSQEYTPEDIESLLKNSSLIIGLIEANTQRLVGFTHVLTDYFKFAYIYDVVVAPEHRGKQLGKKLIELILENEIIKKIENIELTCRKEMIPFYQKFGFSEDYGEVVPMRRGQ